MHLPTDQIVGLSLSQQVIPNEWKFYSITPVHKSGDRSMVKNYRPISLLCAIIIIILIETSCCDGYCNHSYCSLFLTSHKELVRNVLTDEATIITWLQVRHLLADSMTCSKCDEDCRLVARRGSQPEVARLFGASVTRAFFPGAT